MRLKRLRILPLVLLAASVATTEARAPSADLTGTAGAPDTEVRQSVVAGGTFSAEGGSYMVQGTVGEAVADDVLRARGGSFELVGGFWSAGSEGHMVFADGFEAEGAGLVR